MGLGDALFGKKLSPAEQAREWKFKLKAEERQLDRQLRDIGTEEVKIKTSMKQAAKRNDMDTVKTLAKALAVSRKAKNRIVLGKAQINSVALQLQQMQSQAKVMGALQKSSDIMKCMNSLCKIPELAESMRSMQMEMDKAGLLEEMTDDMMESIEPEVNEAETEAEIGNIMGEVLGTMLNNGTVGKSKIETKQAQPVAVDEEEDTALQSRVKALTTS